MQGHTGKSQASRLATLAIVLAALPWGTVLLAQPGPPPVPPAVMVFVFEEGPFIDDISPGFDGLPAANDNFVKRGTETQIVTCVRAEHALRCHIEAQSVNTPWAGDGVCSVSQWEGDMTMQWQRGDRTWRAIVAGNRQEIGTAGWTRVVTLQPLQAGRWRLRHAWLPTNGICEEPDVPRPGHLPWCRRW